MRLTSASERRSLRVVVPTTKKGLLDAALIRPELAKAIHDENLRKGEQMRLANQFAGQSPRLRGLTVRLWQAIQLRREPAESGLASASGTSFSSPLPPLPQPGSDFSSQ
jgi:hypothetical protein